MLTKCSPIFEQQYGNRATSARTSHGAEEHFAAAFDSKGRLSGGGGGAGGGGLLNLPTTCKFLVASVVKTRRPAFAAS